MILYMTTAKRGHFQFFTNKKEAIAYKKYLENMYGDVNDYVVEKITLKNKNQFITFLNNLSCQESEGWDMFGSPLSEEEKLDLEFERKCREGL